jgi:hypothetical protein
MIKLRLNLRKSQTPTSKRQKKRKFKTFNFGAFDPFGAIFDLLEI